MSVSGYCHPGFQSIRDVFAENFATRDDVGAAFALTYKGEFVVDLWGGFLDEAKTIPWPEDGLCTVWSLGKAVSAICALQLVERGLIELDGSVADYWPEFGCEGKSSITVRHLLSHQAGLPALQQIPPNDIWTDSRRFVKMLERQKPWWPSGTRHGYHVHTFATLVGELVRRVSGQSLTAYSNENISRPLGVEFYFSNEASIDNRIADNFWGVLKNRPDLPINTADLPEDPDQRRRLLSYMPALSMDGELSINSRAWRGAQFPSTASQSNARSLSRIFGVLANGGCYVDASGKDSQLLKPDTIKAAYQIQVDGIDATIEKSTRFGLGFMLTSPQRPWGPNPHCFGHYGNNGLLGFADPDANLGFAYTMNNQGRAWRDPRNIALVDAVYSCLET